MKKTDGIQKLEDGKFRVQLRMKGQGFDRVYYTFEDALMGRAEALLKLRDTANWVDHKLAKSLTVADGFKKYFNDLEAGYSDKKKGGTIKRDKNRVRPINRCMGQRKLRDIRPQDVNEYKVERLASESRFSKPDAPRFMSRNSVRLEIMLISALFTHAIKEWQMLTLNPVEFVSKPNVSQDVRQRRLSEDGHEEAKLMGEARAYKSPHVYFMVPILLETGMRAGELMSVERPQVSFRKRVVTLDFTKNGSSRTVPLSRRATDAFAEAMDTIPSKGLLVFPGETGQPYHYSPAWATICLRAGVADLNVHDLRHEAISRFYEETDLTDAEIAAICGHLTPAMQRRYTHLRTGKLVARLDGARRGLY